TELYTLSLHDALPISGRTGNRLRDLLHAQSPARAVTGARGYATNVVAQSCEGAHHFLDVDRGALFTKDGNAAICRNKKDTHQAASITDCGSRSIARSRAAFVVRSNSRSARARAARPIARAPSRSESTLCRASASARGSPGGQRRPV